MFISYPSGKKALTILSARGLMASSGIRRKSSFLRNIKLHGDKIDAGKAPKWIGRGWQCHFLTHLPLWILKLDSGPDREKINCLCALT